MGSSIPSRSCPPRRPRGAWPASSYGIRADSVTVAGQLREALSGLAGPHRSIVDLTGDLTLKHGRVDEGGFRMRVTRRVAARAVFDENPLDAGKPGSPWRYFGASARTLLERRSHSSKPMRPRR